ncbi:MAG: hypothetical protein AB1540_17150 [Bdellovibrionota bacterium]
MTRKVLKQAKKAANLSVVSEPTVFFKQEVTKALQNQKVNADPETEFYLVDLLRRFMLSENLFAVDKDGNLREEVLALLMGQAATANSQGQKQQGLRRLGDVSLYTAGFFSDSLSRKVVDVDYYIGMGRSAYASLAHMGFDAFFQKTFTELSSKFPRFVDVLAEISESSSLQDTKNILRLYEVWLKTRSERAEKSLKEAGIIPNTLVKPDVQ